MVAVEAADMSASLGWRAIWLVAVVLGLAGCDHHDAVPKSLADVVFVMDGGDEALAAMLAKAATQDPLDGPAWLTPQPAAVLPADPTALQWQAGSLVQQEHRLEPAPDRNQGNRAAAGWLADALLPSAWAHGAPLTGRATLVDIRDAQGKSLLRVFTKGQSYIATAAQWQRLQGAGPLTGQLLAARFANNRVVDGPWLSAPVAFEVAQ